MRICGVNFISLHMRILRSIIYMRTKLNFKSALVFFPPHKAYVSASLLLVAFVGIAQQNTE